VFLLTVRFFSLKELELCHGCYFPLQEEALDVQIFYRREEKEFGRRKALIFNDGLLVFFPAVYLLSISEFSKVEMKPL